MTTDKSRSYINWLLVLLIVAVIAGGILTYRADIERKHDVDDIKIELSNMRSSYDPNSGYYGKYYVYTDYTVTNKTKAVLESLEVIVTYKDANGKQLTQVRTSFGRYDDMNLERKESVTLESYLDEQKISDSTAMSVLYGKELSEFVVEYEITKVRWTDGVNYNEGNMYY